jgi:hypothetical protein
LGGQQNTDELLTFRPTTTLLQTAAGSIFTVTGKLGIYDIIGEITTLVQAQADASKLLLRYRPRSPSVRKLLALIRQLFLGCLLKHLDEGVFQCVPRYDLPSS